MRLWPQQGALFAVVLAVALIPAGARRCAAHELVGPPRPKTLEPFQLGRVDPPKRSLASALAPLLLASGLDFLSTEKPLGFLSVGPVYLTVDGTLYRVAGSREKTPLPGMSAPGFRGTANRVGWGVAEALMAALLCKKAPRVGGTYVIASTQVHSALISSNWQYRAVRPGVDKWHCRNLSGY